VINPGSFFVREFLLPVRFWMRAGVERNLASRSRSRQTCDQRHVSPRDVALIRVQMLCAEVCGGCREWIWLNAEDFRAMSTGEGGRMEERAMFRVRAMA
jgi:hypothetical protein